jgi:hypothetical protein
LAVRIGGRRPRTGRSRIEQDQATSTGTAPLPWQHCAHGASPADPVGCTGIRIPGRQECLVHTSPDGRAAYLATLAPGADVDLRGTTIDEPLLRALRTALTDPGTNRPRSGDVDFRPAIFSGGEAYFGHVAFSGRADFGSATFSGDAHFGSATFGGGASFVLVAFSGCAYFRSAAFGGCAGFESAAFSGGSGFV